jgi:hypothetical protein
MSIHFPKKADIISVILSWNFDDSRFGTQCVATSVMGNGFRKFSSTLLTKTLQLSTIHILHVNLFIVEDHIKLKHFRPKISRSVVTVT